VIHVIEPTLSSEAGHCSSFVGALAQAHIGEVPLQLWMDRSANMKFDAAIEPRRHFIRWLRRPQSFLLFRRLLHQPGKIFVSTATLTDLRLFALAARTPVPPLKAYFYFHWMKPSASKVRRLKHIAARHPNIMIFGPTELASLSWTLKLATMLARSNHEQANKDPHQAATPHLHP